jgi:hypothetical protein
MKLPTRLAFITCLFGAAMLTAPSVRVQYQPVQPRTSAVVERVLAAFASIHAEVTIVTPVFAASMHEYD